MLISTNQLSPDGRRVLLRFCITVGTCIVLHTMWRKEELENLALSAELKAFRDSISPQLRYPDKDDFKDPRIIRFTY